MGTAATAFHRIERKLYSPSAPAPGRAQPTFNLIVFFRAHKHSLGVRHWE